MTGVSSVWSFVNQKVVTQFPSLLSRFQRISFLSALQGFYVNKLSFFVGIIWQQDFLSLWNDIAAFIQAKFCCFNNANLVWQGFIRTSQIYRSECQNFTWTKPIYCSGWQGSSRTCHPCRLETSLFFLGDFYFQSEAQAVKCRCAFYFCSKPKSGLNYRRSSFAEIDKRTELDYEIALFIPKNHALRAWSLHAGFSSSTGKSVENHALRAWSSHDHCHI